MQALALITLFTDAINVANALTPLIAQQLAGKHPVTDEEVRDALAGKDAALARFDLLIAQTAAAERAGVEDLAPRRPQAGRLL